MKIIAIKEFDNTKQTPLLPRVPELVKVSGKDNLATTEIITRPGTAGAAKVKVSAKILEGLQLKKTHVNSLPGARVWNALLLDSVAQLVPNRWRSLLISHEDLLGHFRSKVSQSS